MRNQSCARFKRTIAQLTAVLVAITIVLVAREVLAKQRPASDPRMRQIRTVFIKGNNEAAVNARKELEWWTCYQLANSETKADAVLEVASDPSHREAVNFTLTTAGGDLIWSWTSQSGGALIFGPDYDPGISVMRGLKRLQKDAWPEMKAHFRGVDRSACPQASEPENVATPGAASPPKAAAQGAANATKEIKLGMTIADVEKTLGAPATKVDLGEKLLYKYKDMTVEFRDGKVADVR